MSEQKHTPGLLAVHIGDVVRASSTARFVADCERTPHSKRPAPVDPEDAAIRNVTEGHKPAHYLAYGPR